MRTGVLLVALLLAAVLAACGATATPSGTDVKDCLNDGLATWYRTRDAEEEEARRG